jgi:hypothetical protein
MIEQLAPASVSIVAVAGGQVITGGSSSFFITTTVQFVPF